MDKLFWIALYPHWLFLALVAVISSLAYIGSALLALIPLQRFGGRRPATRQAACVVAIGLLVAALRLWVVSVEEEFSGPPIGVTDLGFGFAVAVVALLPAAACLGEAVLALRRYRLRGSHSLPFVWAACAVATGLTGVFLSDVAVYRGVELSEAHDIASAAGVDWGAINFPNSFPASYFARQIVAGRTTALEGQAVMRYARARYRCNDVPDWPRGSPGSGSSFAEKYVFLSEDLASGQMVILWYGANDVVLTLQVPESSDYRLTRENCERF